MDMRDLSVARSYAKDILVAEISRQPCETRDRDEVLEARWDRLSDASLKWYCDKIRAMKKERE